MSQAPLPLILAALLCAAARPVRGETGWLPIGPSGGDRWVLAISPQDRKTLYVGGAGGFVHKSVDGAENWRSLATDSEPTNWQGWASSPWMPCISPVPSRPKSMPLSPQMTACCMQQAAMPIF